VKLVSWIIMLPLALAAIAFAVTNRGAVELDLWPLPFTVQLPVFAVAFLSLFVGFVFGGFVAWMSAGKARRRARAKAREAEAARRELDMLREKLAKMEAEAGARDRALPPPRASDVA